MQGTQSVGRALGIQELFTRERPTWTVPRISSELELTVPTAHRLVRTLVSHGYLIADLAPGHYTIGPTVLRLAEILIVPATDRDLHALAIPELEHLCTMTLETVGLHRRVGGHRMTVAELESPLELRLSLGTGRMRPVFSGAVGRVLLAGMADDVRAKALREASAAGARIDRASLDEELGRVVARGYAISVSEATPGASAIAAPIRGAGDAVVAAISISGPEQRWTRERMIATAAELLASVGRIAERLQRPAA